MSKGLVVVLSGASSVGKGKIVDELLKDPDLKLMYSISLTTRPQKIAFHFFTSFLYRAVSKGLLYVVVRHFL